VTAPRPAAGPGSATGWIVERRVGSAARLHDLDPALDATATLRVLEVDAPALVLGSSQPATDVDLDTAHQLGVAVVRRRSGGGAVLLDPGGVVWVDVVVPRHDPRWDDDVVRSTVAVGEWWAAALGRIGVVDVGVHRGRLDRDPLARLLCFGGLGPGELTRHGRKLVGISQRRTRDRARFQVALARHWDPARTARLLRPGLLAAGLGVAPLDRLVATAPDLPVDDLVTALTAV
jgi:lipoate-protein ligase A